MIDKYIFLEDIDVTILYGIGNRNLKMLKSLFPKIRITARNNIIHIVGEEYLINQVATFIEKLKRHIIQFNSLDESIIISIFNNKYEENITPEDNIIYSVEGKPIMPRNKNQQKICEAFQNNDMIFAIGPAGTGKTFLSIALAVKALKEKEIKKIILSRPAVEAGEKIGFLPGDMKEKIDPYLQPLYDSLEIMIPQAKLQELIAKRTIEIAPLAFMRGRTLSNAIIILDEAQNTTNAQLKMFLTRLGHNAKMIITGDLSQIDLPRHTPSGLITAVNILDNIKGISIIEFSNNDIVRHPLIDKIVKAYENTTK